MNEKPVYLTREGLVRLEAEHQELTTAGRKEVAERIAAAKELGDISESGEYEDAKNSQALLEGRIREIKNIISRAQIIEDETHDMREVHLGCTVTLKFDNEPEEEQWMIVGSAEAKPLQGKMSNESPIGAELMGKKVGQKVTVQAPAGIQKITILRIS